MQVLFEDRNLDALQEMVNGLSAVLDISHVFFVGNLDKKRPSFEERTSFFIENGSEYYFDAKRTEMHRTLIVHLVSSPSAGQGVTPKWLWDAYEAGATILRIRPSSENLSISFLRSEAQTEFEREISLPSILGGLMIPPIYCENGILTSFYNKKISEAIKSASQQVIEHRPIAILAVYNERDIIEETIIDLINEECDIVILDNWSDDGTFEVLELYKINWPDRILNVRRYPDRPSAKTSLTDIVSAKEEIALGYPGRWIINADADEFRRSPIKGLNLAQALICASNYGANRVNFTVLNFRPVDDGHPQTGNYRSFFKYFELPDHGSYFVQSRAWLQPKNRVDLASSAGHVANFDAASDFPLHFWMKHIPIRSPLHAAKKIIGERAKRWSESELQKGWHTHYSNELSQSYIWAAESLHRFDDASFLIDYNVMVATPLAKFFSPIQNGHRSEMRRWVDDSVTRIVNQQKHDIDELQRKHDLLDSWLRSLDFGIDYRSLETTKEVDRSDSLRSQLNSTLVSFILSLPYQKRRFREKREAYEARLLDLAFFRNNWYLNRYQDVAMSGMNPAFHYLKLGAKEGRDPTSYFSTLQYLSENPDVAANGMNPLVHFILHGAQEGRNGVHRII